MCSEVFHGTEVLLYKLELIHCIQKTTPSHRADLASKRYYHAEIILQLTYKVAPFLNVCRILLITQKKERQLRIKCMLKHETDKGFNKDLCAQLYACSHYEF